MAYFTYRLRFKKDPRYYYFGKHAGEMGDGYRGSGTLVQEYRKRFGDDCFSMELLQEYKSNEEALMGEEQLVGDLWKTDPFCLNKMPGGGKKGKFDVEGLIKVHKDSVSRYILPETVESWLQNGWVRGNLLKTRQAISKANSGRKQSKEERERRGKSIKKYYQEHPKGPLSEEHREKLRKAKLGNTNAAGKRSEESRRRMSESHKGLPGVATGRRYITNGVETKLVFLSDNRQLEEGWWLGRTFFRNRRPQ